jgi:hypothetical protein
MSLSEGSFFSRLRTRCGDWNPLKNNQCTSIHKQYELKQSTQTYIS